MIRKVKTLLGLMLLAACPAMAQTSADPLADLPLVLKAPTKDGPAMVVFLSGDGGWAKIDSSLSDELLKAGYGVVGLNGYRYFRSKKTPAQLTRDLTRISNEYLEKWHRSRLLLLGYSRGAEVLPFAVARLDADLKRRIDAVVLLGPSTFTNFKLRLSDFIESHRHSDSLDVLPEVRKVDNRIICVYGLDEKDSLCPLLRGRDNAALVPLPGAHHFDQDYAELAQKVLTLLGRTPDDK